MPLQLSRRKLWREQACFLGGSFCLSPPTPLPMYIERFTHQHRGKPIPGSLLTLAFTGFVHQLHVLTFTCSLRIRIHAHKYTHPHKHMLIYLQLLRLSLSIMVYPTIGQKPERLFSKMRSTSYHEASRTQPQLEWKCDVSVLCGCLCVSV